MKDFIAILAGVIGMCGAIPYLRDMWQGTTKPNVVSWFTWTILTSIGVAAAFAAGEPKTAYITLGNAIGTAAVLVLGFWKGYAKLSWFDGLCQLGALVGLLLWFVFDSPTAAILAVVLIDSLGLLPTVKHAYHAPQEETWQNYALVAFSAALGLLALSSFSIVSLAYPLYILFADGLVTVILLWRRATSS